VVSPIEDDVHVTVSVKLTNRLVELDPFGVFETSFRVIVFTPRLTGSLLIR